MCHARHYPAIAGANHVYCGRKHYGTYPFDQSPLHNPFKELVYGRELAISMFHVRLERALDTPLDTIDAEFMPMRVEFARLQVLRRAGDLYLFCWCAPLACHCDAIKAELEGRE